MAYNPMDAYTGAYKTQGTSKDTSKLPTTTPTTQPASNDWVRVGNRMVRSSDVPNYSTDKAGFVGEYYGDEYLNPDGTYNQGMTRTYTGGSGPNGPITVTNNKTTPETHPWLYSDSVGTTRNDYSQPIYPEPGKPGYVQPTTLSEDARRGLIDTMVQNRSIDPRMLQGMSREGAGDTYTNQYGQYTRNRVTYDPVTGEPIFNPAQFQGQDMQGNAVNYRGEDRYGSRFKEALRRRGVDPVVSGVGGGSRGGSFGTRFGTPPDSSRPVDTFDRTRSWSNTNFGSDDNQTPGNSGQIPATGTPAMTALKRAIMAGWGR